MQGLRGVERPRGRRAGPLEMTLEEEFAAISDAAPVGPPATGDRGTLHLSVY